MKRRDLIRRLERAGCIMIREGARHTVYLNPATRKTSTVPGHIEVKERLALKILDDLGIDQP